MDTKKNKNIDFKHPWVNADGMLAKCLVGTLVPE